MLTDIATRQPDYIALGIVAALFVVLIVMVIRKQVGLKRAAQDQGLDLPAQEPVQELPTAPGVAGQIKLHDVEPKTAAMLMAIVANRMDKPLNELRFISIKEVK